MARARRAPIGRERARINAQTPRRCGLAETPGGAGEDQLVREGGAGRPRIDAEQGDDRGQMSQLRGRAVQFPVGDGGLIDTESISELALAEAEIEPPRADVISNCCKDLRVGTG